jgi:hypothetical protein
MTESFLLQGSVTTVCAATLLSLLSEIHARKTKTAKERFSDCPFIAMSWEDVADQERRALQMMEQPTGTRKPVFLVCRCVQREWMSTDKVYQECAPLESASVPVPVLEWTRLRNVKSLNNASLANSVLETLYLVSSVKAATR